MTPYVHTEPYGVDGDKPTLYDVMDDKPWYGCSCRVTETNPPCECEAEAAIAYWQTHDDLLDEWVERFDGDHDAAFEAWLEDGETGWEALIR